MESREQRKKLLQVMHKDGETQLQKELRDYEIESLLELNIPYFEIDAHSTSIFDGDGVEHTGYLPCTPYESWIEHMKQISIEDMERQCDYIRLSMGLLNKGYIGNPGKEQKHETIDDISLGREIEVQIQKIVNWLIRNAVIEGISAGPPCISGRMVIGVWNPVECIFMMELQESLYFWQSIYRSMGETIVKSAEYMN